MPTAFRKIKNNATGKLLTGIGAGDLTLTLKSGEGASFPSAFPFPISIDQEILEVGARTGDVLSSLTRAVEGTSAAAHADNADVELRITAKEMSDLQGAVNALEVQTTKGDLIGFSTVSARIPVGADAQVLTADAAQALGLKWAAAAGGGHTIRDDGVDQPQRTGLNFIGPMLTVTDDAPGGEQEIGFDQTQLTWNHIERHIAGGANPFAFSHTINIEKIRWGNPTGALLSGAASGDDLTLTGDFIASGSFVAGVAGGLFDADRDTGILVEKTADLDEIWFQTGGGQPGFIRSDAGADSLSKGELFWARRLNVGRVYGDIADASAFKCEMHYTPTTGGRSGFSMDAACIALGAAANISTLVGIRFAAKNQITSTATVSKLLGLLFESTHDTATGITGRLSAAQFGPVMKQGTVSGVALGAEIIAAFQGGQINGGYNGILSRTEFGTTVISGDVSGFQSDPFTGVMRAKELRPLFMRGTDGAQPAKGQHRATINAVGGITASQTTIPYDTQGVLGGTLEIAAAGSGYVENEKITWTGKTATDLTGVTRGADNTLAATHADNTQIIQGRDRYVSRFDGIITARGIEERGDLFVLGDSQQALVVVRVLKLFTRTITGSLEVQVDASTHTHLTDVNYKVEIDTAGDISAATFRWSDDGGATWDQSLVPCGEAVGASFVGRTVVLQNGLSVIWSTFGTAVVGDNWTWTAIGSANQVPQLRCDTTNERIEVQHRVVIIDPASASDRTAYIERRNVLGVSSLVLQGPVQGVATFGQLRADFSGRVFIGASDPGGLGADRIRVVGSLASFAVAVAISDDVFVAPLAGTSLDLRHTDKLLKLNVVPTASLPAGINGMLGYDSTVNRMKGYINGAYTIISAGRMPDEFGDGSDGAVTISVNTTLTRDMFYSSLTVNNGITLTTAGFKIFVSGTLTNNGTITRSGGAGTAGGAGSAALAAGTLGGSSAGTGGGFGGTGAGNASGASTAVANSMGGAGAQGGSGGSGPSGGGGAAGAAGAATYTPFRSVTPHLLSGVTLIGGGSGGSGGGGGGGDGTNAGARGGGAGAGGAVLMIFANSIINNGSILANGGAGGNGAAATVGNTGGGGGGSGGGGGVVFLVYNSITAGTIQANGGALGTGGAGFGTGTAGATGAAGAAGRILRYNGQTESWE